MNRIITIALALMFVSGITVSAASIASDSYETTSLQAKPKKELKEVTFSVHLHCKDCVKKVEENISFEKGVKDLVVSLEDQTVYIKYDPKKTDEAKLKNAIEKLGYKTHKQEK